MFFCAAVNGTDVVYVSSLAVGSVFVDPCVCAPGSFTHVKLITTCPWYRVDTGRG